MFHDIQIYRIWENIHHVDGRILPIKSAYKGRVCKFDISTYTHGLPLSDWK